MDKQITHYSFSPDLNGGQTVIVLWGRIWLNIRTNGSGIIACGCGWEGNDCLHFCGKPWNFRLLAPRFQISMHITWWKFRFGKFIEYLPEWHPAHRRYEAGDFRRPYFREAAVCGEGYPMPQRKEAE